MENEAMGMQHPDDEAGQMENLAATDEQGIQQEPNQPARPRKKHHDDHHVSRKYRMFSNYSSNNDMPHTNTSF